MNNKIISVIVVLVLIVAGYLLFRGGRVNAPGDLGDVNSEMPADGNEGVDEIIVEGQVKEFSIDATPFTFSLPNITVNEGDTVRVTLKNIAGVHDFKLDEFNATTKILQAGESETIEFVADKKGSFEYYCSVGNHRALGMIGTLTVE